MVFYLADEVVPLGLDNITAQTYLCDEAGTVLPFLFRLICCILNLADRYDITLISAYIPTHLNLEADYLSWGRLVPEFPCIG